jgi:hypothetical protein
MPSNRSAVTTGTDRLSRRAVLAALGTGTAISFAGCTEILPWNSTDARVDPAEVVVENRTSEAAEVAVRVTGDADETLFSRVFAVGPESMVGGGAIESVPSRIHAFTAGGVSRRWRYAPDLSVEFDCEIKDVGLTLHADETIEPWYDC